jgi:hypothetical protein
MPRINGVPFGGARTTPIRRTGGGKPPQGCRRLFLLLVLALPALAAVPALARLLGGVT